MANNPTFSNVTTLLDFEAGLPLVDQSDVGAAWDVVTDAGLSSAQAKFGSQSLDIVSDGYIEYTGATTLFDVAGDFTIQMWARLDAIGTAQTLVESGGLYWGVTASGALEVIGQDSGSSTVVSMTSTETLTANTWHYLEINRVAQGSFDFLTSTWSPLWYQFVDGVSQSGFESGTVESVSSARFGRKAGLSGNNPLIGYIDDIRITDGEALNNSNYTPPAAAHPTSGAGTDTDVRLAVASPLQSAAFRLLHAEPVSARLELESPLKAASLRITRSEASVASLSVASPLQSPRIALISDFTSQITDPTERYIVQLTGDPVITVPVSSWQGTLQLQQSSFLQAVVPAAAEVVEALTARRGSEEFVVLRQTEIDGQMVSSEMARAPIDTVTLAQGPFRYTATVQGYSGAFTTPVASGTTHLAGLRSKFQTLGGAVRVRCDIDWLLRPGGEVTDGSLTFTCGYINYFVPSQGDSYMDIGTRG